MSQTLASRLIPLAALALMLGACADSQHGTDEHAPGDHGHDGHADADIATGPHGGRLLVDGDFALEVILSERGTPPEFRLYPMHDGAAVPPSAVAASIALSRINGLDGGRRDRHDFAAREDYLVSAIPVDEPHSFAVDVEASYAGRQYRWQYDAPEAQVRIDAAIAQVQGIRTATAAGGVITERIPLSGAISANPQRQRRVAARYPGLVRSVAVQIGDVVSSGQPLATIESNESLQTYTVSAPIAGVVTQRAINAGELANAGNAFEILDLSTVWAQLEVFPRDVKRIRVGQTVAVESLDGSMASAEITWLSPLSGADQRVAARVELDNPDGRWRPGQFVSASVVVDASPADLLVPLAAVQRLRDWNVVFAVQEDVYQALPVELGRRDSEHVEILSGLDAGARIVVANSYLLKADIDKSGAAHDH